MKINYEILKNATDQDGKPFIIVKMPVPDIDYMTFALDTVNKNNEIKFLRWRKCSTYSFKQAPKLTEKAQVQASVQRSGTGEFQAESHKSRFAERWLEQWGFSQDEFVALWDVV